MVAHLVTWARHRDHITPIYTTSLVFSFQYFHDCFPSAEACGSVFVFRWWWWWWWWWRCTGLSASQWLRNKSAYHLQWKSISTSLVSHCGCRGCPGSPKIHVGVSNTHNFGLPC